MEPPSSGNDFLLPQYLLKRKGYPAISCLYLVMHGWAPWVALLVASLGASVFFIAYAFRNREQRGATPLLVVFVGGSLWIIAELVLLYHGQVRADPDPLAWGGLVIRLIGVEVGVVGVLLLGLEYTGREYWIRPSTVAILSIKPIIVVAIAIFQLDLLIQMPPPAIASHPWGFEVIGTQLWTAHFAYSSGLMIIGLGLLADMMVKANYAYRLRVFGLMFAISIPLFVNALFNIGLTPFDLTASSFLATAIVLMYTTFQWRLMDPTPVARRTVIDQMEDMVFTLDGEGHVTLTNSAVEQTFDNLDVHGMNIEQLLGDESLGDPGTGDRSFELSIRENGSRRQFDVDKSVLYDYRGDLLGQVLVCRDVTEKHRREEQLELLKDVQSRFLRHNLRNELNTILAHADFMRNDLGPPEDESYEAICESGDRLVEWEEKARTIERLVEDAERTEHDIGEDIAFIVERMRERYPAVVFEYEPSSLPTVYAVPQVDSAIENLLDNAAEYNTSDSPVVNIQTEQVDGYLCIHISDNGPGIDPAEIETIEAGEETQLKHSSGFGLWLAYWVVDISGGDISFDIDGGTTVTLEFEIAETTAKQALP